MSDETQRSRLLPGSIISLMCVVYQSLYRAIPNNGDLWTGLPIGEEFARPGLFSQFDLIVSSGMRSPYHLYKYLGGFLFQTHSDVDLVWHLFFLAFLFLTFLSVWYLSLELSGDILSSGLVVALVAVAHPLRGSLHAAAFPLASFVTAQAAMPLALAAIVLVLRHRHFPAMALSGIVFNLHPYVGLLTGFGVAAAILFTSKESLRSRVTAIIGGGLFAVPNIIYVLSHLPANFAPVGYDFYAQFRYYQMHVFVEDHWREGYGWFFTNIAGVVWFSRYIDKRKQRILFVMFVCWFMLMGGYVVNAYLLKNKAILLMYLFRATYFIKPIIFILVIHGIRRMRQELRQTEISQTWWSPTELSVGIAFLFISAILPMDYAVVGDILSFIAYGFFARQMGQATKVLRYRQFFNALLLAGFLLLFVLILVHSGGLASMRESVENIIVGFVVCVSFVNLFLFRKLTGEGQEPRTEAARGHVVPRWILASLMILLIHHGIISMKDKTLPFVPDVQGIKERILMHRAPAQTAGVMNWARTATPEGAMFVVPPDEWNEFGSFRLVTGRSLFVTITEVNQLSLDASVYHQAHERLVSLGVGFPRRREFDTRGYYTLTDPALRNLAEKEHADYFIAEKGRLGPTLASLRPAYTDEHFVAIDLHHMVVQ